MNTPAFSVRSVSPRKGHVLELAFADGKRGTFDMTPYLEWDVYARLRDEAFFSLAQAAFGTVVWPANIDIAPELLYEGCVEA